MNWGINTTLVPATSRSVCAFPGALWNRLARDQELLVHIVVPHWTIYPLTPLLGDRGNPRPLSLGTHVALPSLRQLPANKGQSKGVSDAGV